MNRTDDKRTIMGTIAEATFSMSLLFSQAINYTKKIFGHLPGPGRMRNHRLSYGISSGNKKDHHTTVSEWCLLLFALGILCYFVLMRILSEYRGGLNGTSRFRISEITEFSNVPPEPTQEALADEHTMLRSSPNDNGFILAPYHRAFTSYNPQHSPPYVVFYHIVIDPDDPESSLRVVEDQMELLSTSFLAANTTTTRKQNQNNEDEYYIKPITVFYNTIGLADYMNHEEFSDQCLLQSVFICRHMRHYHLIDEDTPFLDHDDATVNQHLPLQRNNHDAAVTAVEFVTLERLYDFATTSYLWDKLDPSFRIIYLRTFDHDARPMTASNTASADVFRTALTQAPLTEECNTTPLCNVCGYQFNTQSTLFFPGNMWSAELTYIRKLLSPHQYRKLYNNKIVPQVLKMILSPTLDKNQSPLAATVFPIEDDRVLLSRRYSAEHWITSHPQVQPCDWSIHQHRIYHYDNFPDMIKPVTTALSEQVQFMMAPRHQWYDNIQSIHPFQNSTAWLEKPINERLHEYFGLAGHIYKWTNLYQQLPSTDSWIWNAFPDGNIWKENTIRFGLQTFHQIVVT
jgi:hypothetical protein